MNTLFANPSAAHVRVVAFSANTMLRGGETRRKAGIFNSLIKPIEGR